MQRELKSLLDSLHSVFNKNPMPSPALRISFDLQSGVAFLTIEDHTLTVTFAESDDSTPFDSVLRDWGDVLTSRALNQWAVVRGAHSLTYNLREWTLERFAEHLGSHQGFTVTVLRQGYRRLLAAALLDGVKDHDLATPIDLKISTSQLWALLKPVAYKLADASDNIDIALEQLNPLDSKVYFADFWGARVGIPRKVGETDAVYTERIINTILLQRSNNLALEKIIKSEFNVDLTIIDALPLVLDINNSIVHSRLPGEVYNTGNFLVTGPATSEIRAAIEKHKAAGTKAFYIQLLDATLSDTDQGTSELFSISIFDAQLNDYDFRITTEVFGNVAIGNIGLPLWRVGFTPFPGSVIG